MYRWQKGIETLTYTEISEEEHALAEIEISEA